MITLIIISVVLTLILSQLVAYCHLSSAKDRSLVTKRKKVFSYFMAIFDWPFRLGFLLMFLKDARYSQKVKLAIIFFISYLLVLSVLWHYIGQARIYDIFAIQVFVFLIWWVLVYVIRDIIQKLKNSTVSYD